ncbi:MAG: hypothetical protein JXX14_13845 [Deltaproteobacteria bacterium]|nr:hypothetical protein [Deltaproteobacteria bacterium]
MVQRKSDQDIFEKVTREMTPEQVKRLADDAKCPSEKETVPEIPVRKLLEQYEKDKAARQSATPPPAPRDRENTEPGVPIYIGGDKVIWVEGDKQISSPDDDDSGEIVG